MVFLAVVTADGGLPLFTRSVGENKMNLPFATVATLNGLHMFSRLKGAEFKRFVTKDKKVVYREYHERIVLIIIITNENNSDCHASTLLDNIFAAMAMVVGIDLLLKPGDVTRLQKALVASYPLIDALLNQLDPSHGTLGDLTLTTDCLFAESTHAFQNCMNKFLDVADSLYGCLLIKGKVVTASKEWWTLTNQERVLMCIYINSLPKVLSHEVMIYLPTSSPQNSNRLISLHLLPDVEVCVLCSADPPLAVLEEEAPKIWKDCFDLLKNVSNLYPKNFPQNVVLDKNILSVILINLNTGQSICSLQPSYEEAGITSKDVLLAEMNSRQKDLRSLYRRAVGTFLPNMIEIDEKLKGVNTCPVFDYGKQQSPHITPDEFYILQEDKDSYVMYKKHFQIFIIYNKKIPFYALRSVTLKTLERLKESCFPADAKI